MKDQVPKEASNGESCHISHLRIFGCVYYAHVPKQIRKNLDDISECIFVLGLTRVSWWLA